MLVSVKCWAQLSFGGAVIGLTACSGVPSLQIDGVNSAWVMGTGPRDLWVPDFGEAAELILHHSDGGPFSEVPTTEINDRAPGWSLLEPAEAGSLWVMGHGVDGPTLHKIHADGSVDEIDTASLAPDATDRSALYPHALAYNGERLFVVTGEGYPARFHLSQRTSGGFESLPVPDGTTQFDYTTATDSGELWSFLSDGSGSDGTLHRWDGTEWTRLPEVPLEGGAFSGYPVLRVRAPDDVWFGLAHWDGAAWTPGILWGSFGHSVPNAPENSTIAFSVGYIPIDHETMGVVANISTAHRPTRNTSTLRAWRWRGEAEPGQGRLIGTQRNDCTQWCPGGVPYYLEDGSVAFSFDNGNGSYSTVLTVEKRDL